MQCCGSYEAIQPSGLGLSPDAYRTEWALDPLRDREDFRLHVMELAMPAEPFAR